MTPKEMAEAAEEMLNEAVGHCLDCVNLKDVCRLLDHVSNDSHEARLEVYSTPTGAALCFKLVPRDEIAPDYLRRRPAGKFN